MSMESSQSKKKKKEKEGNERGEWRWEGAQKKKESRVKRVGWAVCICDVCVLCLPGTVVLLSVELHCTVRLSKLLMRIWGKYNLGAPGRLRDFMLCSYAKALKQCHAELGAYFSGRHTT